MPGGEAFIVGRVHQAPKAASFGVHDKDVLHAVAVRRKGDLPAVRRPGRLAVVALAGGQAPLAAPVGVDHVDIVGPRALARGLTGTSLHAGENRWVRHRDLIVIKFQCGSANEVPNFHTII